MCSDCPVMARIVIYRRKPCYGVWSRLLIYGLKLCNEWWITPLTNWGEIAVTWTRDSPFKSAYSLSGCNTLAELMDMFESMCHIRFFPCLGDLVPVLKLCAYHFDHYLKSFTKGWRQGVSWCFFLTVKLADGVSYSCHQQISADLVSIFKDNQTPLFLNADVPHLWLWSDAIGVCI